MHLIKYTHACVRLEHDGRVLVIDPGTWSEAEAIAGAGDILVTHEHADHIDVDRLVAAQAANPELKIYTHAVLAESLAGKLSVTTVAVGQTFTAAGFQVHVVGGEHAEIYEGLPGCANVGFIVDGSIYHPGDSTFVPGTKVETLLVPANAPWLKLREAIDFVRDVAPARAFPIHDALLSERGFDNFDRWIEFKGNTEYARIAIGDSVTL
jgi:L-ascorbate metabolism protein UlaG (beta-lactamase superfamily)